MKPEKYRQLTEAHLLHRIWRNELELALQEVNFWEELLGTLNEITVAGAEADTTWTAELSQLHHFRRLSKRLLQDIDTLESEVAKGVRLGRILDAETRLDHQYLRTEMDSFHTDFRTFKTDIRRYMTELPAFQ
ncbi:hypothetical protein GGR92_002382 [Spirosoma lacussanchae]|uniref:hypothetical protein n=1 Tax=Spirosoma lacussanchae TaxID=1884249 RepID=UPI0011082CCC|nr:hypothetical protein [Spirosoma lacussanchae]